MKIVFSDFEIEIGDWTPKLKIAAIIFASVTIISAAMTLFLKFTIPGVTPLALGLTMLLLGVKEFNIYFKERKNMLILILGIILTLLFVFNLCIGINQIIAAMTKQAGL